MQSTPSQSYVVTVVPATPTEAKQTSVSDLLIGSVSMAGALLAVALVLGLAVGGIRVALRRLSPPGSDQMPPVSPFNPDSRLPPPSPPQ